jgi:AcrR family transcriptional regulator
MARRKDHSRDELKGLILQSASKIVENEGFENLTVRKIAFDIGYTPGTLYNIFESMDALVLTLNVVTLEKLLAVLSSPDCNNPKKTAIHNMKAMAAQYRNFAFENKERWLMLFNYILPEGLDAPEWYREKTSLMFEPLEKILEPYFSKNQTKQRKIAARTLWASIHGICFLQKTKKLPLLDGKDVSIDIMNALIDNFVKGLSK